MTDLEARFNAQVQLDATLKEYQQTTARLHRVKTELAQVEKALEGKRHLVSDEQARMLQATNAQISAAQEELRALNAEIEEKQDKLSEILTETAALARRLGIG